MKHQILKILKNNHYYEKGDLPMLAITALEITDDVMKFILWKDNFTHFDIEQQLYMVEIETHVIELMDLNGVYLYWFENKKE